MTLEAVEALLKSRIGLNPESIGPGMIEKAVRQRMSECYLSGIEAYLTRLQTSEQELEELIEWVVVPETWFFRDEEPFAFMVRYVISEWLPSHKDEVLRVLSVPCSTGEEPYSIAMALMDAGLMTPQHFHIDAVDISRRALLKAKRALYGSSSFRGENLAFRRRYFEETGEGYQLISSVRDSVHFIHANLLDRLFLDLNAPYDVVFCRNLMIYLDPSAREKVIKVLDRYLTRKGLIFVGHAETFNIPAPHFVSVRHPRAFAYRRPEDSQPSRKVHHHRVKEIPPRKRCPIKGRVPPKRPVEKASPSFHAAPSQTPDQSSVEGLLLDQRDTLLGDASRLANQGHLEEARALCERIINEDGPNAQTYCLWGLIEQASGDEERAEACFNKAVYLKPSHYEALISLALIAEHCGDAARAAVLRRRAERVQSDRT
jgi:chemotaxis protein methyltransferase WspC